MSSSKSPLREENRGARTAAQHPQRHSPRSIAVAVVDARRDWFDVRVVLSQLASSLSLSSGEIINALGRVRRQTGKSIERPRARARSRKGIVNALDHPALPILRKKLTEPEAGITFAEGKLTSSQRDSRREREAREGENDRGKSIQKFVLPAFCSTPLLLGNILARKATLAMNCGDALLPEDPFARLHVYASSTLTLVRAHCSRAWKEREDKACSSNGAGEGKRDFE